MAQVAIVGSIVQGMTTGEHHGHSLNPHPPCTLTGTVIEGTSKFLALGVPISLAGAQVTENDCCGAGTGNLGGIMNKIRVRGVPVQVVGNATVPHNGSATIQTGTPKVHIK